MLNTLAAVALVAGLTTSAFAAGLHPATPADVALYAADVARGVAALEGQFPLWPMTEHEREVSAGRLSQSCWNEGMAVGRVLVHSQVAFAARDVEIDRTTSAQVYDSTLSARCRSEWAAHTAALDAIINTR
jgi:hypothetical protein